MANNQCDRVIDYFNNDLDETEKLAFEEHLFECEECKEELKELKELTSNLPFASEPQEPPAGMKERILFNVLNEDSNDDGHDQDEKEKELVPMGSKQKMSWFTPFLAAALLLSLIGNAYEWFNQNPKHTSDQGRLSVASAIKSVHMKSTGVLPNGKANAAMIKTDQGGVRVVLTANGLKPLKGKKVYQVWLIDGKKPYRAGTFVPDQQGSGGVSYTMNLSNYHTWDKIAITIEPTSTSKTPHGKIILASKL